MFRFVVSNDCWGKLLSQILRPIRPRPKRRCVSLLKKTQWSCTFKTGPTAFTFSTHVWCEDTCSSISLKPDTWEIGYGLHLHVNLIPYVRAAIFIPWPIGKVPAQTVCKEWVTDWKAIGEINRHCPFLSHGFSSFVGQTLTTLWH